MYEFNYTGYPQEIIFGAGSLDRLPEVIGRFGWRRLLLCSTNSMRKAGHIDAIQAALGSRLASVFEKVQPHVPDFQVVEVLRIARASEVDAVIGLGGGSSVGMAKAVSFALEGQSGQATSPLGRPRVPVIAIPTTYAGSEMTPVYGVTRHDRSPAQKVTVADPRIVPALVLYDPRLTLDLPPDMTASTGINALAHCLEALYSTTRNPISSALALRGVKAIFSSLPCCFEDGSDLEARTTMLEGSMLAGMALAHVAMGLHHGLCHVLGGSAGVPHGVANAIILPHALRFNLDATAPQLAQAAEAIGITVKGRSAEDAGRDLIESIEGLISGMDLPAQLRDTGVREEEFPRLAELALQSRAVQANPKPVTGAYQIEEILLAAW